MKSIRHIILILLATFALATPTRATMYFGRAYDANLQRWTQRDPIGEAGGINLYQFVGNNPVNWIDPYGLAYHFYGNPADFPPGMSPLVYGDTTSEKAIAAFGDIGGSILNGVAALNNFFHWGVGRLGGSDQDADALLLASGLPEANLGGAMDGTAGLLGALKGSSKCENVARGGTYLLRDAETGQVMRTGRTSDLARRAAEHGLDPLLRDFEFEPVHRTDVYNEQRGLEQLLHDMYQPPLNKIRPISPANPNLLIYQDAANGFPGNP